MSDEALVSASRAGDRDAFRKLVERHAQRVYSFLRRRVSSDEDASDLAQEVFVTAYTSLSRLRSDADFGGWLLGIARNQWKPCTCGMRKNASYRVTSWMTSNRPSRMPRSICAWKV